MISLWVSGRPAPRIMEKPGKMPLFLSLKQSWVLFQVMRSPSTFLRNRPERESLVR